MKYTTKIFIGIVLVLTFCFGYIVDSTGVSMRDSIRLGTDLYYPEAWNAPWPTILQRTPYNRNWSHQRIAVITDVLGYALVVQNLRGWGDSEGNVSLFLTDGWGDLQDGYDAIEWVAAQSWSDGKVGMIGGSAHAMTQYLAAGAQPQNLVCGTPWAGATTLYHQLTFIGGEFRKALIETWCIGQGTPFLIDSVCNHPDYDTLWAVVNLEERYDVADYAFFHLGGWFDLFIEGAIEGFSELQSRHHNQKLYVGPWIHSRMGSNVQGQLVFPPNAIVSSTEFFSMIYDWYNYWLQDSTNIDIGPKVMFYLMGDCDTQDTTHWNYWVEADTWPLPDIEYKNYYLQENNALDTTVPQITAIDTFQYDPSNPCPTYGGREYIGLTNGYGPIDQRPIENRRDVLVFSTAVLDTPLTVIGKLNFVLYAASDRFDTDWTVRVTDVYPDGRSMLIADNILMARHRHGFDRQDSLVPNVPDTFNIDLWSTAQVFNTGHRLRVIVSSSNYPRFERNPNTGAPFQRNDPNTAIAIQKIYRSQSMPSHLILPVYHGIPAVQEKYAHNQTKKHKIRIQAISSNPKIYLNLLKDNEVTISLFDITGRKLWSFGKNYLTSGNYTLALPRLANGVYFVHSKIGHIANIVKTVVIK